MHRGLRRRASRTAGGAAARLGMTGVGRCSPPLASPGCMVGPDPRTPETIGCRTHWASPLGPTDVADHGARHAGERRLHPAAGRGQLVDEVQRPGLNSLIDRAVRANLDVRVATAQVRQARAARGVVASGLFPTLAATGTYKRSFSGGGTVSVGTVTGGGGTITTGGGTERDRRDRRDRHRAARAPAGRARAARAPAGTGTGGTGHRGPAGPAPAAPAPPPPSSAATATPPTSSPPASTPRGSWTSSAGSGATSRRPTPNIQASIWNRRAVRRHAAGRGRDRLHHPPRLPGPDRHRPREPGFAAADAGPDPPAPGRRVPDRPGRGQRRGHRRRDAVHHPDPGAVGPAEIYALSVLLAMPPGRWPRSWRPTRPIPTIPPEVPIGMPSDLLRRRPDVRNAEFLLHQQTARRRRGRRRPVPHVLPHRHRRH